MNGSAGRGRLAGELAIISLVVTAGVVAVQYAVASRWFDYAVEDRAESARTNFVVFSAVLSALGTAAGWVVWLWWRRRADVDGQPDGPARLLAMGVATLPQDRHEWGEALIAELASIDDRGERWRFAVSGACTTFGSPAGWERPAAGWAGAAIGAVGVMACVAATIHLFAVDAGQPVVTPGYVVVTLVALLAACLVLLVAAPAALTSNRLARHVGVCLGSAAGVVLLATSRAGTLDEGGALTIIGPAQLLAFVVAPAVVAAVTRSLQAAMQCIVWGFVFSTVTMLPVYIIESIGHYREHGVLFLDAERPFTHTVGDDLTDAVSWLVLIGPGFLIPLGVLAAAAAATIAGPETSPTSLTRTSRGAEAPLLLGIRSGTTAPTGVGRALDIADAQIAQYRALARASSARRAGGAHDRDRTGGRGRGRPSLPAVDTGRVTPQSASRSMSNRASLDDTVSAS